MPRSWNEKDSKIEMSKSNKEKSQNSNFASLLYLPVKCFRFSGFFCCLIKLSLMREEEQLWTSFDGNSTMQIVSKWAKTIRTRTVLAHGLRILN